MKNTRENNIFHFSSYITVNCDNISSVTTIPTDDAYIPGPYDVPYLEDCRAAAITYGVISCIGILANLLALMALASLKKKETGMLFLFSLVAADLVSPTIQLILVSRDPTCNHTYRATFMKEKFGSTASFLMTHCFQAGSLYAIIFTMLGMACDRLIATVKPFQHHQIVTKCRLRIFICFSWLFSFVAGFLPFLMGLDYLVLGKSSNGSESQNSIDIYLNSAESHLSTSLTILFGIVCVCFIFFVIVYGIIFHEIRRHHQFTILTNQQARGIVKGTVTTLLIVGTFAVCWLPYGISYTVSFYSTRSSVTLPSVYEYKSALQWRSSTFALVLLNSLCDPVVYICRNKKIRYAFTNFLTKLGCTCINRCYQNVRGHSEVLDNITSETILQTTSSHRTSLTAVPHRNIDEAINLRNQDTTHC